MDWYNLSFSKYAFGDIAERLTEISIAFETLFRLQEKEMTLYDSINQTLNIESDSPLERWSRDFYGKVRSATMHFGKPAALIYKHPEASEGHIGFLISAQKIFRECLSAKAGLERKIENNHLIEELTPNEVVLKELRALGSYENIKESGQLRIWQLKQQYPLGDKDDIIWLGNILLNEMMKQISESELSKLVSIIKSILESKPDDNLLWSKYVQLDTELNNILFKGEPEKVEQLSQCIGLAYEVNKFAEYAWFALQMLTYEKKRKG